MSDPFYRAFEEKFRGSRSLIRSRLGVYRAFISPLNVTITEPRGLDLGCLADRRIAPHQGQEMAGGAGADRGLGLASFDTPLRGCSG